MKSIGILTFWGVPNYGAFAQAYALNKVVKHLQPDADVEHIAYLHPQHFSIYYRKPCPKFSSKKQLVSPRFYYNYAKWMLNHMIKYPEFEKDWDCIRHKSIKNESELEENHWDIIITGSDAIWEYSVPEFGNDIHLIGNNLNCDKLISYAASFGDMNENDVFFDFIKTGLKNYDCISVRDKMSSNIVNGLIRDTNISIVLDPTLLYDFKNDKDIPKSKYSHYILVYGTVFSERLVSEVKEYAKEHSLLIIGAGLVADWCDVKLSDIGPKEWIGLFQGANFVVTCTFHGLMFSVNYEKIVVFNQVQYVKNRSTYLLKELGLYSLYENEVSLKTVMEYTWDYKKINHKLEGMRDKSLSFLKRSLDNE